MGMLIAEDLLLLLLDDETGSLSTSSTASVAAMTAVTAGAVVASGS